MLGKGFALVVYILQHERNLSFVIEVLGQQLRVGLSLTNPEVPISREQMRSYRNDSVVTCYHLLDPTELEYQEHRGTFQRQ